MQHPARLTVPAIGRAVDVMDLLAETGRPRGLSDMARDLGIAKSTLHGLCDTMVTLGLLQQTAEGFEIGPHALRWSAAYLARNDLSRGFARLVADDAPLADHTLTLSTLEDGHVVYIGCRNAARPPGFTFRIGMRVPAVYSATGKAILSSLTPEDRRAQMPDPWPAPFTPRGTPDAAAFEAQVPDWQRRGYAVDAGEIREGMVCVGVAIRGQTGRVVAGLAVSMTESEVAAQGIDHFAGQIRALADRLAALTF